MSRHPSIRAAAAVAVTALFAMSAQAQQSYDLRVLSVSSGVAYGQAPLPTDEKFNDRFNNGDPLTGPGYANGVSGMGSYRAFGTPSAGAELSGPATDFFGQTSGVGRMRFQLGDAAPSPSNLDATGTVSMRESLALDNLSPSLLQKSLGFEVETYWNYTLPDSGSSYGTRLSDNPANSLVAGQPFNDLIDLRLIRGSNNAPLVALRRLEWDGTTLSQTQAFFYTLSNYLPAGKSLADIAVIGFNLHYNAPTGADTTGGLLAGLDLIDANGVGLGHTTFTPILSIFNGETTTKLVANAQWTVSTVPEPGTAALWVGGLLVAALRGRAMRRG